MDQGGASLSWAIALRWEEAQIGETKATLTHRGIRDLSGQRTSVIENQTRKKNSV